MKFDFEKLSSDTEYRARVMAQLKAREEARLESMTPAERADYDRRRKLEEERDRWLGERSTLTNGEIERERVGLEQALDHVEGERDEAKADADKTHRSLSHALDCWAHTDATLSTSKKSQGGTDRALTRARQRIEELEKRLRDADGFEVEELKTENADAKLTPEELAADLPPEALELILAERTAAARGAGRSAARSSQGGTDRALSQARARIAALEAEVAKLTEERDAARKAYLDLLGEAKS